MTLKKRLLVMTISISVITIVSVYIIILVNVRNSVSEITNDNTRNLLNIALQSIKNQYTSLIYHKEYSTNLRKTERQNYVAIAKSLIQGYYSDYQEGKISEADAQKMALQSINEFRYDKGKGYIWINNTEKPVPRMILHPILPELNNQILSDSVFYSTTDSNNLFCVADELCETKGNGFVEYLWTNSMQTEKNPHQEKLSYVEIFKPWQWIIGTGIYLEDIEKDVRDRKEAILDELKQTIGQMKIFESGYFFIFNGNKEILLHPALMEQTIDSALYLAADSPLKEIIIAATTQEKTCEYTWNHPLDDKNEFAQNKKAFVQYFEPLDWYICASIYQYENKKSAIVLGKKILIIALVFLAIMLISFHQLSESLTRPLYNLMNYVLKISDSKHDIDVNQIPVSGTTETRALSQAIKVMLNSIQTQRNHLIKARIASEESAQKLRASEKKYRTLFFSSGDGVLMLQDHKIIECNKRAVKILKGKREEIIGLTSWDISPAQQPDGSDSKEKALLMTTKARKGKQMEIEWLFKNFKDELLNIDVTFSIIDPEKKIILATWRDVTARKTAEKALRESEEKYRFLVENSPTLFFIIDKEYNTRYLSPNIFKMLGFSSEAFYTKDIAIWDEIIHKQDYEYVMSNYKALFDDNKRLDISYRIKTKNEEWIWIHSVGEINIDVFGENVVYGIATDITEKKLMEQRVLQAMINSEEKERSRIAKDMHDGVSPLLSAINLFTQSMRDTIDEKVKFELSDKISSTVKEAILTTNEISANLSPHVLENFGLIKAIESFLHNILEQKGINYSIDSKLKDRLSPNIEITLYRISIELINNTIKHAGAKNVWFEYSLSENEVRMFYKDDGIGFDANRVKENQKGMGLFNIKNRINSLNGLFEFWSEINKGIRVSISIPNKA